MKMFEGRRLVYNVATYPLTLVLFSFIPRDTPLWKWVLFFLALVIIQMLQYLDGIASRDA